MKTSKLLLLTFIGLIFTVMDVSVDLINRDSFVSAEQLHATAKAYVQKYISSGNETYTKIQEDIREEHIKAHPPAQVEKIYNTGNGDTLCHIETNPGNPETGIYFYSSPEAIMRAINEANAEGMRSCYVSMQDLLWYMGLDVKGDGVNLIGWNMRS